MSSIGTIIRSKHFIFGLSPSNLLNSTTGGVQRNKFSYSHEPDIIFNKRFKNLWKNIDQT